MLRLEPLFHPGMYNGKHGRCAGLSPKDYRKSMYSASLLLQATGQGDFTEREFDIVFNMDLPVNETDIINNARNSVELISKRTILENHPWVTDVEEEMARIDEEKQQSMQDFGAGLFDDSLKLNDDAEVNTAGGDDEDEE